MYRSSLLWIGLSIALATLNPVHAHAQRGEWQEDPHWAAKLMLGLGGEAEFELGNNSTDDDMEVSWGAGLHYLHPLFRYFAIGGMAGFSVWQTDRLDDLDADSNLLFDLAAIPAGLLPIGDKLQLYAALPIGLSMNFPGDDATVTIAGANYGAELDPALGFTISLLLGVRFAVSDGFGLLAELGYTAHSYEHDADLVAGPFGAGEVEFDVDLEQVALNLGVWF